MEKFKVNFKEEEDYCLAEITIEGGQMETEELEELVKKVRENTPKECYEKGIVISGRMPVWAFGALVHEFHPASYVATFDPRLIAGVVVASHTKKKKVGELVPIKL